jgi:hypothetical protein
LTAAQYQDSYFFLAAPEGITSFDTFALFPLLFGLLRILVNKMPPVLYIPLFLFLLREVSRFHLSGVNKDGCGFRIKDHK